MLREKKWGKRNTPLLRGLIRHGWVRFRGKAHRARRDSETSARGGTYEKCYFDCGDGSATPEALLGVERGEHHGFVVDFGGVLVDGGSGLGAEVAVTGIEVEGADVVRAVGAGELHASLDAGDGVEALHNSSVVFRPGSERHGGGAAKVTMGEFQSGNAAQNLLRNAPGNLGVCFGQRGCVVMGGMRVTQKPVGRLGAYVEQLWYCDGHGGGDHKGRLLPHGRFQLFFSLSDSPIGGVAAANWEVGRGASSLVVGIETHCVVVETKALQTAMGVLFRPGGARTFFDAPADVFYNERVPLERLWGSRADRVRDRLREASTAAGKFQVLEMALLERMNRPLELHAAVRYALGEFGRAPHLRRVLGVVKETGLSRRRFAQLFREQVGLTPKLFCRLHRFQSVMRQIATGAPVDWADLALAGGFCDQSHLANEFRTFSGISPHAYLVKGGQ